MPAAQLVSLTDAQGGSIKLQHNTAVAWAAQVAANPALSISPYGAYRAEGSPYYGAGSHGYGTCIDIWNSTANQWAIDHFPSSVWVRDLYTGGTPSASNEGNHWHYKGTLSLQVEIGDNVAIMRQKNFAQAATATTPAYAADTYTLFTEYEVYEIPTTSAVAFKAHYSPDAAPAEIGLERHTLLSQVIAARRAALVNDIAARVAELQTP